MDALDPLLTSPRERYEGVLEAILSDPLVQAAIAAVSAIHVGDGRQGPIDVMQRGNRLR